MPHRFCLKTDLNHIVMLNTEHGDVSSGNISALVFSHGFVKVDFVGCFF